MKSVLEIKRNKEIYQKIESGKTYAETAREYGLSRERIRQIYNKQGGNRKHLMASFKKKVIN